MSNRMNVAELLKDCPKGMKLDCTMFDDVTFVEVNNHQAYPIEIKVGGDITKYLTEEGCYHRHDCSKCVIFPKGKTTWEGFQRPFKDGDVVFYSNTIAIFKEWGDETLFRTYCTFYTTVSNPTYQFEISKPLFGKYIRKEARFATLEEKEKLFQAIDDNGYVWDSETKTLGPKFKDGDILFVESTYNWVSIYKENKNKENLYKYVAMPYHPTYTHITHDNNPLCCKKDVSKIRLASEEEKEKFFKTIEDNGYVWNPTTKTLEKLPKFKDGDIVVAEDGELIQMFLLKEVQYHKNDSYDGDCYFGWNFNSNTLFSEGVWGFNRFATEEEKQKLFQVINDNGYVWNPTTKTLEKLVTIFKVGDKIKLKNVYAKKYDDFNTREITDIKYSHYILDDKQAMPLSNQYLYELVSDKVDITSLKLHTGDVVKHKQSGVYCTVEEYAEGLKGYHTSIGLLIPDNKADEWEIMPDKFNADKFDITTLKPFDKVLVRTDNFSPVWRIGFYDSYNPDVYGYFTPFCVTEGGSYQQCIPFEGNEHLRGKTDDCSPFFKTWE